MSHCVCVWLTVCVVIDSVCVLWLTVGVVIDSVCVVLYQVRALRVRISQRAICSGWNQRGCFIVCAA